MQENTKPAAARYIHSPLDTTKQQIRLFRLCPSKDSSIHGTLHTVDLDHEVVFSALSYVWGPEFPSWPIYIDGKELLIRENLYRFLMGFEKERPEPLWIDQICIAQSSVDERNHQVQMMSAIYRQSRSVIIWLNDEEGDCHKAAKEFATSPSLMPLITLLTNIYFQRLWIVQEILLSQHIRVIVSGGIWLDWEAIRTRTFKGTLTKSITTQEVTEWNRISPLVKKLLRLHGTRLRQLPFPDQIGILAFSANTCSETQDKVYGLMSLLSDKVSMTVDYRKPIFDVYAGMVLELAFVAGSNIREYLVPWQITTRELGYNMGLRTESQSDLMSLLEFLLTKDCNYIIHSAEIPVSKTSGASRPSTSDFESEYGLPRSSIYSDTHVSVPNTSSHILYSYGWYVIHEIPGRTWFFHEDWRSVIIKLLDEPPSDMRVTWRFNYTYRKNMHNLDVPFDKWEDIIHLPQSTIYDLVERCATHVEARNAGQKETWHGDDKSRHEHKPYRGPTESRAKRLSRFLS